MNEDDIQQIFFVECEEALEATEEGLDACKAGTHDDETINAIFRGVHSIKGGAGAFGHAALASYTHCFENLLGEIREGAVELEASLVDLLLRACDLLRDHVEAARNGGTPPDDASLMGQLEAARASGADQSSGSEKAAKETAEDVPQESDPEVEAAPSASVSDLPLDLGDDLDALLDELSLDEPEPVLADTSDAPDQTETEQPIWQLHIRPHSGAMDNGGEPLLWLRELERLGGLCESSDLSEIPQLHDLSVDEGYLGWTFTMPGSVSQGQVKEIFDFVGEDCSIAFGASEVIPPTRLAVKQEPAPSIETREEPKAEPQDAPTPAQSPKPSSAPSPAPSPTPTASRSSNSQSVRIDLSKLDRLIDGVGELVIAQAMLAQRLENESFAHIEELAMLETLVRDIQEHAMAFRAQPISSVFGRVPRLLRELAGNTGKSVKLEIEGETTELDKTVIERLSEPMTHLIRNAVDHGIESPKDRKAAGKDPEGTLYLSAEQKAGRIVIKIRDDGAGINRERVLEKAIANGIVAEDASLCDDEINQLIFAPGFSTAASVTSVSGRGVGMDVVKSNVRDLGGRIAIESTEGEGTTFILALPLTLAISDGMIVQTGDQSLVIPLTHVIESLRPGQADLKGLGTERTLLHVRGKFVPVVSLGKMTGAGDPVSDPTKGVLVLVETESHGQAALLVDAITDQRQFVIKSLDAHYRSVDSVAGATILGNGQVSLIVDIDFIVQAVVAPASLAIAA
ncbi:MAG: chemotaxis protein CheA [Pseudomonadota bacterium]